MLSGRRKLAYSLSGLRPTIEGERPDVPWTSLPFRTLKQGRSFGILILTFLKFWIRKRIKMHRRFSEEFKKSAITRVQNGESQLSVAKSLGISHKTLNRWFVKAKEQMPEGAISLSEENARLRKALKEREAEIAFLKKAAAYFAKVP